MLRIHAPSISYTSVSLNLLQQVNARGGSQTGIGGAQNGTLPGLIASPSSAVSAIMRILVEAEGFKASAISTGTALSMGVESFEWGEGDNITRVRAAATGNIHLSVNSSNKDMLTVDAMGGDDFIQVAGDRVIGAYGNDGNDRISVHGRGPASFFIQTVNRVQGGSGNDAIAITSQGGVDLTDGGDGNDTIAISARSDVFRTYGGDGNDAIAVSSSGHVNGLNGEDGNDVIAVSAAGSVDGILGGDGNDAIAIATGSYVGRVEGGAGRDTISVSAKSGVLFLDGGDGDDVISISAVMTDRITGGDGNDVISISAEREAMASGGDGNDLLQLSGSKVWASGGTGNDQLKLDSTSGQAATLRMAEGDGNDVVETNAPLNIARYSADGTRPLDPSKATLAHNGDGSVTVRFEGSNDSVTVKFTGAMAGSEIGMRIENGNLVIGAANGEV